MLIQIEYVLRSPNLYLITPRQSSPRLDVYWSLVAAKIVLSIKYFFADKVCPFFTVFDGLSTYQGLVGLLKTYIVIMLARHVI